MVDLKLKAELEEKIKLIDGPEFPGQQIAIEVTSVERHIVFYNLNVTNKDTGYSYTYTTIVIGLDEIEEALKELNGTTRNNSSTT